jgi:hypothetical protein
MPEDVLNPIPILLCETSFKYQIGGYTDIAFLLCLLAFDTKQQWLVMSSIVEVLSISCTEIGLFS